MFLSKPKILLVNTIFFVLLSSAGASDSNATEREITKLEARLSELETRLMELEQQKEWDSGNAEMRIEELEMRLAKAEQEVKTAEQLAKESASRSNIEFAKREQAITETLAISTMSKPLWTQEKQWEKIKPGITMEKVIELLGQPTRSLDSLKPRVDKVFYYQTSFRETSNALRGKISFRKSEVLTVEKPDFEQIKSALN